MALTQTSPMSDAGPGDLGERFRAAREARGLSLSDVAEQIRHSLGLLWPRSKRRTGRRSARRSTFAASCAPTRAFSGSIPRKRSPPSTDAARAAGFECPGRPGARPTARRAWREQRSCSGSRERSPCCWSPSSSTTNSRCNRRAVAVEASASPDAARSPPSAAPGAPHPVAAPAPGLAGANSLAVTLSAPSWLRVTVDGNVSMEGTFPAGTSKTFHGKSALVRVGNAGGVEVYVDGKARRHAREVGRRRRADLHPLRGVTIGERFFVRRRLARRPARAR